MDACEAEIRDRAKHRLDAQETKCGGHASKMVDAGDVVPVLHAHADPDVRSEPEPRRQLREAGGSLRQHLEPMPRCPAHHIEDALDVRTTSQKISKRFISIEQVDLGHLPDIPVIKPELE